MFVALLLIVGGLEGNEYPAHRVSMLIGRIISILTVSHKWWFPEGDAYPAHRVYILVGRIVSLLVGRIFPIFAGYMIFAGLPRPGRDVIWLLLCSPVRFFRRNRLPISWRRQPTCRLKPTINSWLTGTYRLFIVVICEMVLTHELHQCIKCIKCCLVHCMLLTPPPGNACLVGENPISSVPAL